MARRLYLMSAAAVQAQGLGFGDGLGGFGAAAAAGLGLGFEAASGDVLGLGRGGRHVGAGAAAGAPLVRAVHTLKALDVSSRLSNCVSWLGIRPWVSSTVVNGGRSSQAVLMMRSTSSALIRGRGLAMAWIVGHGHWGGLTQQLAVQRLQDRVDHHLLAQLAGHGLRAGKVAVLTQLVGSAAGPSMLTPTRTPWRLKNAHQSALINTALV